eukprot:SAG31_NODE_5609_length_2424_cov_2.263656_5_plen_46_part_01
MSTTCFAIISEQFCGCAAPHVGLSGAGDKDIKYNWTTISDLEQDVA